MLQDNATLTAVVEAMTQFASTTQNDRLSVEVARVAHRLQHMGNAFERPITRREMSVIRPFLERVQAAA